MTKREPRFIKMAQDAIAHTLRSDRSAPDVLAEHFDACWQASARKQMERDANIASYGRDASSYHIEASIRESFEREVGKEKA